MRRKKPRTSCAEVPIFCGLVVQKGFDPDAVGPVAAGRFGGLGLDYRLYEFDWDNPAYYRTKTIQEMHADIPTGTWPIVGGDHGTTDHRAVASPEGGEGVPGAG